MVEQCSHGDQIYRKDIDLTCFTHEDTDGKSVDWIAAKYADKLPLVFGKWEHYRKKVAEAKVIEAMRNFRQVFFEKAYTKERVYPYTRDTSFKNDELMRKILESKLREDLTHHVLFFQLLHPHLDEALKWAKVLVDDSDLKDYMHKELDRDERDYEERLKKLRLFKKHMKRLE